MIIKLLALAVLFMACEPKEVVKKKFVKPEKVSGYACSYDEEVTARLFDDDKFASGHSFCFQPSVDFAQVTESCQKEGGLVGVVCKDKPDVTCETDIGNTLYYGPNWNENYCP